MNWKSIGTTFRVYTGAVNFDHVDEDRGFFCGTHNYVEFYAVNVEDNYGGFFNCGKFFGTLSGEYFSLPVREEPDAFDLFSETEWRVCSPSVETRTLPVVVVRGEVVSSEVSSEMFGRIRELLEHRCGCPDSIKTPPKYTVVGDPSGERLAQKMGNCFEDVLHTTRMDCPSDGCEAQARLTVWSLIMHLNDTHKWSRERVADWLEYIDCNPEFPMPKETQ